MNNLLIYIDPNGLNVYKVDKDGYVKYQYDTKKKYDVLENHDGSKSVVIEEQNFLPQFVGKNRNYSGHYGVTNNRKDAGTFFEFVGRNANVEWGASGYKIDAETKYVLNTYNSKRTVKSIPVYSENNSANLLFHVHTHPTKAGELGNDPTEVSLNDTDFPEGNMKKGSSMDAPHYAWDLINNKLIRYFYDRSKKHERLNIQKEIRMRLLCLIFILSNIIFCQEKNSLHENVTLQIVDDFLKHCNSFPDDSRSERILVLSFLEKKSESTLSLIYTSYYKKDLFKALFKYKGVYCIVYSFPDTLYKKFIPIKLSIITSQKDILAFEFENNFGIHEGIERTYKILGQKNYKKISDRFLIPPNYWQD